MWPSRAGEWFALLGWPAAALKCRPPDRFIGWPPLLHYQRLQLIANHYRFLILPHAHRQNLASRVMATLRNFAIGRLRLAAIQTSRPPCAAGRLIGGSLVP